MGRSTPRRGDADCPPLESEPAADVAAAAFRAVEQAGSHLGTTTLGNGLTAEQVLSDPANRAVAARWRSGPVPRRITAALARAMQSLQEWSPSGALAAGRPAPAEPLPVRSSRGTPAAPAAPAQLPLLPWWVPRPTFRTGVLLLVLLLFPRVVALVFALVFRLLSRAAVNFLANVFLEVYNKPCSALRMSRSSWYSGSTNNLDGKRPRHPQNRCFWQQLRSSRLLRRLLLRDNLPSRPARWTSSS